MTQLSKHDRYGSLEPITEVPEFCTVPLGPEAESCGKPILTMTYKGTGMCGDICRKRSGKLILGEAEQAERLQARNP